MVTPPIKPPPAPQGESSPDLTKGQIKLGSRAHDGTAERTARCAREPPNVPYSVSICGQNLNLAHQGSRIRVRSVYPERADGWRATATPAVMTPRPSIGSRHTVH